MFDAESEALIREVYAKDFAQFGYATSIDRGAALAETERKVLTLTLALTLTLTLTLTLSLTLTLCRWWSR